jgi:hypothetical protein
MLTSYVQASKGNPAVYAATPDNRRNRFRAAR